MSSIDCANACSYAAAVQDAEDSQMRVPSRLCSEGWSYQIATKRCYFLNQVNVTILQPNSHLMEKDMTIGWATGLRSCSEPDLDGGWSGWSAWTAGVADCQVRVRNCDSPVPCGAGLDCKGEAAEYDNCPDPVNGQWGLWGAWTSCSVTCGGGLRTRTRLCNNPAPANGGLDCPDPADGEEEETCNNQLCPAPVNGGWSEWSISKECISCSLRSRANSNKQKRLKQVRSCTNHKPANGGKDCEGEASGCSKFECLLTPSPTPSPPGGCQWSSWAGWGACNKKTCKEKRKRTCSCQSGCVGDSVEERQCGFEDPLEANRDRDRDRDRNIPANCIV